MLSWHTFGFTPCMKCDFQFDYLELSIKSMFIGTGSGLRFFHRIFEKKSKRYKNFKKNCDPHFNEGKMMTPFTEPG